MTHVHVIGAGLSGLSAALSLTAAGRPVTVHEAGSAAGGRCRSYFDKELGLRIDNGNHLLLSGNRAEQSLALSDLLAGYEDFCEFDTRELYLIEALRTLRLIHYAAWLARRWHDPAFPAAFPWFNTPRYWEDRILELREQIAMMSEPPLWPV